MHEIILRRATPEDIFILRQFEQGVIEAERPFDSTLKPGLIHYYDLEKLMHSEDSILLVATKAEELIGSGYALIKPAQPYLAHDRYAYLGFMYVIPELRGQGMITRIIDALKLWCHDKGLAEIRLEVYDDNHPAIKAYQKSGFEKHLVEMRLKL